MPAVVVAGALAMLPGVAPLGARAADAAREHPRSRPASAHAAVIGGAAAQPGAFSSVVDVVDVHGREGAQCTGTVVAPTLVLTAGHCAENMSTGAAQAAAGFRVLVAGAGPAGAEYQILAVSGVIVYERFTRRTDEDDAALLVLSTPTTAAPVMLATSADGGAVQAGARATIAGWGDTRYAQRRLTETLTLAGTVVQGARWCSRNAPPFFSRSEICTVDPPSYATGACHGDSGGPLLAAGAGGGELIEIGIAVHGYGRCSTRLPSVFTRAESIAPWVQTWIRAYRQPPATPPAPTTPAQPTTPTTPTTLRTPTPPAQPTPPTPPAAPSR